MLAVLLIVLSAVVAVLAITDFLLPPIQKTKLAAKIGLWNILDEARGWSFSIAC